VTDNDVIDDPSTQRAVETIRECVSIARRQQVRRISAVATEFARRARNGGAFSRQVSEKTGVALRVISGEEEARLTYLGVISDFDRRQEVLLIFNVGSRSTEISSGVDDFLHRFISIPLGAATVSDELPSTDKPLSDQQFCALLERVSRDLQKVSWLRDVAPEAVVIGSGGAFVDVAFLSIRAASRTAKAIHLETLRFHSVRELAIKLYRTDGVGRREMAGMDPARADLSVGEAAIVLQVMREVGIEQATVSVRGLSDGVIAELHGNSQAGDRLPGAPGAP
jgi:exopolyphosphatase/guanosine-5'-triphosphate,3'-diphosphate pyrophosphatase